MIEQEKLFPIHPQSRREFAQLPSGIPWFLIAPFEARAQRNHSQSLETLARRGGLGAGEMWAVLNDKSWKEITLPEEHYVKWLLDYLKTHCNS